MSTPVATTSAVYTPFLAAEYLVQRIGEEAAQTANMPESVWVEFIDQTMKAHFRFVDPLANPGSATEGAALPVVAWSPDGVVITAGLDGQAVQVSKVLNAIAPEALAKIAQQSGTALGRSIDAALTALFASLTAGTVGTTATALKVADILKANAFLDANFANTAGGYEGRLHPIQFGQLYRDILGANFGVAKISLDSAGKEIINIGETILRKNALVAKVNTNADYAGAVYSREAMGLAIAQNPSVEILPIPGAHSFSVDATVAFGAGIVRPTFGALVISGVSA